MKKTIVLKRFHHRGESRIRFDFDWDDSSVAIIRTIKGSRYSSTTKCWYAGDNEDTIKQIIKAFKDIAVIDISSLTHKSEIEKKKVPEKKEGINRKDASKIPMSEKPKSKVFDVIRNPSLDISGNERIESGPIEVEIRINEENGRLAVRFPGKYLPAWYEELKSIGKAIYDENRNEFLIPYSRLTADSLADYFASQGIDVKITKPEPAITLKRSRKELGDEIRSRELGEKANDALELMKKHLDGVRYSPRTNESYLALLEYFFRYFNGKDPLEITGNEVSEFIHEFIINQGYSGSYQNQMISAIKTFYKISGRKKFSFEILERPRRSRALPKVFSKDEVKRILNATKNNKHKLLLWMIYSCGLRRSEVTNIRLSDLDRERGILHIKEGKGRVDRIVPISAKVWEKIDEYLESYGPAEYLFEGQGGGKYSSESVYRVFKTALHNAGIKKDVGVHSLRHSYATHLHETGLDIRYIQELLGHKSTRTTEIYTHVSRRNLISVRSPIEDLDVK
jgi:integrase/recombinase XerD